MTRKREPALFADKVREAMALRQLTQGQLAIKADVSQPHISRILAGENIPAIDIAARLARALEVSLDWLCELPDRRLGRLTPMEDELLAIFRCIPGNFRLFAIEQVRVFVPKPSPGKERSVE